MKLKILYHLGFWGFFTLFFWYQNPKASLYVYIILFVCAMVAYTNLFILLPHYFLKRKYSTYFFSLAIVLGFGVFLLKFILLKGYPYSELSIFQFSMDLFFFVAITSSLKFLREFLIKQELLVKSENEQLKTENALLKSQVNPHFLFNTLNNLYGLILQKNTEQAAEITLKLSDLMRYILESSKIEQVSLQKEVKFLEDYLALEKIRLAQQADIRLEVSSIEKEVFVAPLLFIPLVENAFKHGLQTVSKHSLAHFSLALQGNELYFEAHNSVGQSLENQTKSGTGLNNLRKRLALIYPQKHFLEIEEKENSFKVTLQISL